MKIRLSTFLLILVIHLTSFSQNCTFRGFVYDKETGTPLVSAIVTFKSSNQGAYTDGEGLFAIA